LSFRIAATAMPETVSHDAGECESELSSMAAISCIDVANDRLLAVEQGDQKPRVTLRTVGYDAAAIMRRPLQMQAGEALKGTRGQNFQRTRE
jgi:hypothetical protein